MASSISVREPYQSPSRQPLAPVSANSMNNSGSGSNINSKIDMKMKTHEDSWPIGIGARSRTNSDENFRRQNNVRSLSEEERGDSISNDCGNGSGSCGSGVGSGSSPVLQPQQKVPLWEQLRSEKTVGW